MIHPNDHEWRRRLSPISAGVTQSTLSGTDGSDRTEATAGSEPTYVCPVCAFAASGYDDVYAHLMTAHRKSTISSALLQRR